eukprot:CAMPEP_0179239760 /NCGR_PEP_ID=MMETSP0797-20121207/15627_1 /TAXON_ID=47934 /ORGANISM="Dinophysis acuminata, Strain DAEP01" /LENGTH=156 /DNA_ID=CAMNT_0020947093 /DNA_START=368 /DNA_END=835 /DNA_ORIENTATION=-
MFWSRRFLDSLIGEVSDALDFMRIKGVLGIQGSFHVDNMAIVQLKSCFSCCGLYSWRNGEVYAPGAKGPAGQQGGHREVQNVDSMAIIQLKNFAFLPAVVQSAQWRSTHRVPKDPAGQRQGSHREVQGSGNERLVSVGVSVLGIRNRPVRGESECG